MNGALYSLPYDVLNDFAPISPLTASSVLLFGRKTFPAKDVNELTAWLKANPNKASAGVFSAGSRLLNLSFQREAGVRFGLAPYRGGAPAIQDLVAGQIDLLFHPLDGLSLVQAGSIKGLCGNKRHAVGVRTEYSDLCRDGAAGPFLLILVRSFCTLGYTERHR